MIALEAAKFLWDALHVAEAIARLTAGRRFDDYLSDDMLRSAVERQFEIVGEAFAALRRRFPDVAARIEQLPKAIAFRNVPIHGYAQVNSRLVWSVIETELDMPDDGRGFAPRRLIDRR